MTVLRVDRLWGEDNCRFRRNTCPLIAFLITRNGKKVVSVVAVLVHQEDGDFNLIRMKREL